MKKREFIVQHSWGWERVEARSAASALTKSDVPGGYRFARAVFDFSCVAHGGNIEPRGPSAPIIALFAKPAGREP